MDATRDLGGSTGVRERIRVSYPSVAQLPDDSLVIVWAEYRNEDEERWGNIHAAKVSVR